MGANLSLYLVTTFKPVLSRQTRDRVEMTLGGRYLLSADHFAIKMNIFYHKIFVFKTKWLLNGGDHKHRFGCTYKAMELHDFCGQQMKR